MDTKHNQRQKEKDAELINTLLAYIDDDLKIEEKKKPYAKRVCKKLLNLLFAHCRKRQQYSADLYKMLTKYDGNIEKVRESSHYLQDEEKKKLIKALNNASDEEKDDLRMLIKGKPYKDLVEKVTGLYKELNRVCNGKAEMLIKKILDILYEEVNTVIKRNDEEQKNKLSLHRGNLFYMLINNIFDGEFTYW
ncbi:MAG: hypothetical protein ACOC44_11125 [Promethearchaeia archaeon]